MHNSTFVGNRADANLDGHGLGGGIVVASDAAVTLSDSILSGNLKAGSPSDCHGSVDSNGYNLIRDPGAGCVIAGAYISDDPLLGQLSYNGGGLPDYPISPGSPAIGAGDPAGCRDAFGDPIVTDQRGALRPAGGVCDLGAFEYGPLLFADDFELGLGARWSAVQ